MSTENKTPQCLVCRSKFCFAKPDLNFGCACASHNIGEFLYPSTLHLIAEKIEDKGADIYLLMSFLLSKNSLVEFQPVLYDLVKKMPAWFMLYCSGVFFRTINKDLSEVLVNTSLELSKISCENEEMNTIGNTIGDLIELLGDKSASNIVLKILCNSIESF